jgi:probable phosphoglycerate mutase
MSELWLIRHGETQWTSTRRHTGRTDIPLAPQGERQAELLLKRLQPREFSLVLTSPLRRARDTCALAGYGKAALVDTDLAEWDYGVFEGRTTAEIREEIPGWDIWGADIPRGESVDEVGARADRIIARVLSARGDVALFAHAHLLRVLAARWLHLNPVAGRSFALDPASLSILSYEREHPVIQLWNDVSHLAVGTPE